MSDLIMLNKKHINTPLRHVGLKLTWVERMIKHEMFVKFKNEKRVSCIIYGWKQYFRLYIKDNHQNNFTKSIVRVKRHYWAL